MLETDSTPDAASAMSELKVNVRETLSIPDAASEIEEARLCPVSDENAADDMGLSPNTI